MSGNGELAEVAGVLPEWPDGAPPPPPSGLTVRQRLMMIAAEVGAVGKDRQAGAGGGEKYSFRGYDAVVNATHPVFARWGVLVEYEDVEQSEVVKVPRGQSGAMWKEFTLQVRWRFTGWDGDSFTITNHGEGVDNADKGLGKARSYALKDLLTRMLLIPTDDPTTDAESTEVPPEQHQRGNAVPDQANPADAEAREAGFDSARHRNDEHAKVTAFIKEHVHDEHHVEQLRAMRDPWPMPRAQLQMLHQTAMRLADKETEQPPAGVDPSTGEVVPDPEGEAAGPGAGVVTAEHMRLARGLVAPNDGEPEPEYEQRVGVVAQGLADDPELFVEALGAAADAGDIAGAATLPLEHADPTPDISDDALAVMDKGALQDACRWFGLPVSGAMAELRKRLRDHRDTPPA